MTRKRVLYGVASLFGAIIIAVAVYLNSLLPIITGYAAKNLCSAIFISGREQSEMEAADLNFSFIRYNRNIVNYEEKSVTSRFLWGRSKAIYRDGFGVTLIRGISEETLRKISYPVGTEAGYLQDTISWPLGDIIPDSLTGIDLPELKAISEKLVDSSSYNGNIFAFLVVHKGIPVIESYKPGFTKDTRLLSWSMAKSFMNAMVGIAVKQGNIDISQPVGIEEWNGDTRSEITFNDLMQMQSGLKWNEDYGNRSDVTLMLHLEKDMGRFAFEKPSEYQTGTNWYYSSGTTNIVSWLLRKNFSADSLYYKFAFNELFNKIGAPDIVFEVDASGTFVGSSYLYATARDFARFGLLFMQDGKFNGEQILPEGWVDYSTKVATDSEGDYGAFFWLNYGDKYPSAPENMFMCEGHDGQFIFIMPDEELVVVVLGYSPSSQGGIRLDNLLKDILNTL